MITISSSCYSLLKISNLQLQRYFNLSIWFYPKNNIFKLYEQIMFKTFYFEKPIFAEALLDKGEPTQIFSNFYKMF